MVYVSVVFECIYRYVCRLVLNNAIIAREVKEMPFDGIVTKAITEELQDQLIYGRINRIYQPTETELLITIRNNRKNYSLLLSIHPSYTRLHLTDETFVNPKQPLRFCMHMRKYLNRGMIESIKQYEMERVVSFKIRTRDEIGDTGYYYLVMEIMGRHSNILLLDRHQEKIIDCIKHVPPFQNRYRTILPGHDYKQPPPQNKMNPITITKEQFLKRIDFNEGKIDHQIVKTVDGFSPFIAREIVSRAQLGSPRRYWEEFLKIRTQIKNKQYKPIIYTNEREDFHVIPLHNYSGEQEKFTSVNNMIDHFYTGKAERDRVNQQSRDLRRFITNELDKNERKMVIHNRTLENAKDAKRFQRQGELLTAHMHLVKQGDSEITVTDFYDPEQKQVVIPLQPDQTPSENAQRFFTRYRKLNAARDRVRIEIAKTKAEISYFEQLLQQLEIAREEDIEEIREELREEGYLRKQKQPRRRKQAKPKPEQYTSSDGTIILVGRNNRQNDYVTQRIASRTDIWLHTKDIPGSHVVIRSNNPSEKTLLEAAKLAAYFSRAQQSESVPVDYTEVRYVNKPRSAKPGFVTYVNEQTLTVTPDQSLVKKLKQNNESSK